MYKSVTERGPSVGFDVKLLHLGIRVFLSCNERQSVHIKFRKNPLFKNLQGDPLPLIT